MISCCIFHGRASRQSGLSYVEILLAVVLLAVALVPALQAVQTGIQSATIHEEISVQNFSLMSKMQAMRANKFYNLIISADDAGGFGLASDYSDPAGQKDRLLVYLSYYDADDEDGDSNVFTIIDPDSDGDGNPYTSIDPDPPISLIWVRVAVEATEHELTTLIQR